MVHRKIALLIVFLLSLTLQLIAQQPVDCGTPQPPGADDCGDACVYCDLTANGYSGSTIGYSADPPNFPCGTIENNQWFAFAAGTTTVEFTIEAYNCTDGDGVQGAIYTGCNPNSAPIVCNGGQNNGENDDIVVTANDLVVGQIYWFMVDGWGGDACDYDVTVTQGNTDPPPLSPPGPITPMVTGCEGETVTFMVPALTGASYYEWVLPDGTVVNGEDPFVDYTFGVGGQVCVTANNVCNFSEQVCITVELNDPNAGIISAPSPLCPNEIANISVSGYNMDPSMTQTILISDAAGVIVDIITGSSGTFTHDDCANFQVCAYNYVAADITPPVIGDNINNIDCSNACCELLCQDLNFEDLVAPIFPGAPGDMSFTCFDLLPPMEDLEWTDNCDGVGMVAGVESGTADLCNGGSITRTWEYTDLCGNPGTHTQTIQIDPAPAASFENPPADMTVSCEDIPFGAVDLFYTNNGTGGCLISGTVPAVESGSADVCGGTISYTWEVNDACGNLISHTQTITVLPAPAPTFNNLPPNMTVDCNSIPSGGEVLTFTNNAASGICLIEGSVTPQESGSADVCGGTITYTWNFTDPCGNVLSHTQNITVEPAPAAQFVNPPTDLTVTCDNIPPGAEILNYTNSALGDCLIEGSVTPVEQGSADICGGTITYSWNFTDPCGNTISHIQSVTVEPAPIPFYLNPPGDMTVNCENIPTGASALSYTNNGIGDCLIQGDVQPVESGSADVCGGTITYTWDFTDQCGNNINHVQNITVEPAPDVAFLNPPTDINTTCGNVPANPGTLQYSNNGVGPCLVDGEVSPVQSGTYDECGGTLMNTWEFTDPCGQTITHVQTVNIEPAPPAVFTSTLPQNMTVTCDAVPGSPGSLSYSNNETGLCQISGSIGAQLSGTYDECGGNLAYTWVFTDACGRTIQHIQLITVEPAPQAAFLDMPGPITLACSDVAPVPPSIGYSNGGSGLCSITGNVQAIQSGSYNSCGGNITYTWTFTDDCNRTITHSQNITVQPSADPYFVDLPADLTIDCGEFFPPPLGLNYTNDESGFCGINGVESATVLVLNELEQEYTWTFINPCNGFTISHTQHITQNPTPEIEINPPLATICLGESFDLSTIIVTDINNTNPDITFHSSTPAGPANQVPSPIVSPGVSTTYYILGTNSFACSDEFIFELIIEEPPSAGLDGSGNICYNIPNNINLFDYLSGTPDQTGYWLDLSGMGVDVSNPYAVNLAPFSSGTFTFQYVVQSFGFCADVTSMVTLEFLPEIQVDIFDIACSDDPDFYEVIVNTNGFDITVNAGIITDLGGGQISITGISINDALSIAAFNPGQFDCLLVVPISPPDCNCPNVDPPVNNGNQEICEGDMIPELSVIVGPDETANWYDAASGGALLIEGSLTYTPTGITAPGVYTFYVEAEDVLTACVSSVLTPVQLEILANPEGTEGLLELCDDDNDGFVSFDLTEAEGQMSSVPGTTFLYYESLTDAESGTDPVSSPYTNITTPNQTLYVVLTSPEGCSGMTELVLTVLPLPSIEVEIQDEICLGDNNGSVTIISDNGINFSLDGTNWGTENVFNDLMPGTYTAYVEDGVLCVSTLEFTINPGLELVLNGFELNCENNGTASDATDDFYTISFTVDNNQGIVGTYTLNDGTIDLGTYGYGELVSITIPAEGQSLTLTFTDDLNACSLTQDIGPLNSCSSDCSISLDVFDIECSDNGTPTDATDDFFTITLTATAINGAANNSYNVLINGTITYNFIYGESNEFDLAADGSSPLITLEDNEDANCFVNQNLDPLIPCSDACVLFTEIGLIECNNEGTATDPDDDTFTFEISLSGINIGSGWVTADGVYSGNYDEVYTIGPFLITDGTQSIEFQDATDGTCITIVDVDAPAACSLCSPVLDAGPDAVITCEFPSAELTGTSSEVGTYTWLGPDAFEENTLSITVFQGGWYVLEGDYGGSCIVLDSAFVEENLFLPTSDAGDDATITCLSDEVELSGSGSTNSGNVSYEWINQGGVVVGMNPEVTVSEAGTYTFLVIDNENGCSASSEVIVVPDADLPIADAGDPAVLDCNIATVFLDGSNSSASTNITYVWLNENGDSIGNTIEIEISESGVYTLNVTNEDNECMASSSVEVSENMLSPNPDAGPNGVLNCDTTEVQLTGINSSGIGSLSFEWQNPSGDSIANSENIIVSEAGIYTLIITDEANACTASSQVEVTTNGDIPNPDVVVDGILDCDNEPVLLDGSGSVGTGGLFFEWFDPNGISISEDETISVTIAGTYVLVISDAGSGCTAQTSGLVEVSQDLPMADAGPNAVLNCDTTEVQLTGINSSGTGNLSFEWQNPSGDSIANSENITVSESGIYTLIITDDANGCTATSQVEVTTNGDLPNPDVVVDGILDCAGQPVLLDGSASNGTGGLSFEWFDPNGISISEEEMISVEIGGTYTLVISDISNGCTAQTSGLVEVSQDLPIADAGSNAVLNCDTTEVTLTGINSSGSGVLSFEWQNPSGDSIANSENITVSESGIYTLIITDDGNGCTSTSQVEVSTNGDIPIPDIVVNGILDCGEQAVLLDGSGSVGTGGLGFEWLDPSGIPISEEETLGVLEEGIYTLIISDLSNGCTAQVSGLVEINQVPPIANAGPNAVLNCDTTEVTLTGINSSGLGNISYEWQNPSGDSIANTVDITVAESGVYTLIITDDSNACTTSSEVEVTTNGDLPNPDVLVDGVLDCGNGMVLLDGSESNGTGVLEYEWIDPNGVSISEEEMINVSEDGTYILIISDPSNGCTAQASGLVEVNLDIPNAEATSDGVIDCQNSEVTLNGNNSTGSGTLSFQWYNELGAEIAIAENTIVNAAGTYLLVVTDGNNACNDSTFVTVDENPDVPNVMASIDGILNCNNGVVELDGSGTIGAGNLEYEWQNSDNIVVGDSAILEVTEAGDYTLIVTDLLNGCSSELIVPVPSDYLEPVANALVFDSLDCLTNQVVLDGTNSSGNGDLNYEWFDVNNELLGTDSVISVSEAGTYVLIVTDLENGCPAETSLVVLEDMEQPLLQVETPDVLNCEIQAVNLIASSDVDSLVYIWMDEIGQTIGTGTEIEVSNPGTYTVVLTGENGCQSTSEVIVLENILEPIADAGDNTLLTCDQSSAILDGSGSSGNNISYEWFDPAQISIGDTETIQVGASGTYTLVVTNGDNGCTDVNTVIVDQDNNLPQALATVSDVLNCDILSVVLDGNGSVSQSGMTVFEWIDESTQVVISDSATAEVNTPGVYILNILDASNGCEASIQVQVNQNIDQPIADAGENQLLTCDDLSIQLSGTASNGNTFEYEWFDDNNVSVGNMANIDVVSAGVYTLEVTNTENGCTDLSTVEVIPDNALPVSIALVDGILTCTNLEVILENTGSSVGLEVIYEWQDDTGMVIGEGASVSVSNPGVYTLVVMDTSNNCMAVDDVLVEQDIEDPTAFINEIGALNCSNQSLVLDGTGSAPFGSLVFEWTTINGVIDSGEDTPNPEISEPGEYFLEITNLVNGCTNNTSIIIDEDITPPVVIINTPQTLTCSITEIILDASSSSSNGDFVYSWVSVPVGGIAEGEETLNPTINQAGTYTLTILNQENGCETFASIIVDEDIELPDAVASADDEIDCLTPVVSLDGTGSSTGSIYTYSWTGLGTIDGANTLEPSVSSGGIYTLAVTNLQNGCIATTEVLVNENGNIPTGLDVLVEAPLCYGDRGSIEIIEVIGGIPPFLYSIDNGDNFYTFSIFDYLDPGSYNIIIQDAIGCEYSESFFIPETPLIVVDLGADIIIDLGNSTELNALVNIPLSQIDTIVWSPTDSLSCSDCLNPSVIALNETHYQVMITDINGCTAEDDIILRVRKDRDIYIPNVFSPHNLDGVNDVFMIFAGLDKVERINTFQVFDRWGELVFEDFDFQPNDPAHSWNGKLRDEPMNPAVFVYWAEITFIDGATILFKGDVTLVR